MRPFQRLARVSTCASIMWITNRATLLKVWQWRDGLLLAMGYVEAASGQGFVIAGTTGPERLFRGLIVAESSTELAANLMCISNLRAAMLRDRPGTLWPSSGPGTGSLGNSRTTGQRLVDCRALKKPSLASFCEREVLRPALQRTHMQRAVYT